MEPYPSPEATFTLNFDHDSWNTMARCTKDDYLRTFKMIDEPKWCDYQQITCTFSRPGYPNVTQACEVRRKGRSTWRDVNEKPSFKVKFDDSVLFQEEPCADSVCPEGETTNKWRSKKITLNNQVLGRGGLDALRLFRESLRYKATPLSMPARVDVLVDDTLQFSGNYEALESVSDSKFMKKWFGSDYMLFELEDNALQFKRSGGDFDDDDTSSEVSVSVVSRIANPLQMSHIGENNMLRFYAGEVLTNSWDGMCLRWGYHNNVYIAYEQSNDKFHFVPGGMDMTFQGCMSAIMITDPPACAPMIECFRDSNCTSTYNDLVASINVTRARASCGTEVGVMFLIVFLSSSVVLVGIGVGLCGRRAAAYYCSKLPC